MGEFSHLGMASLIDRILGMRCVSYGYSIMDTDLSVTICPIGLSVGVLNITILLTCVTFSCWLLDYRKLKNDNKVAYLTYFLLCGSCERYYALGCLMR